MALNFVNNRALTFGAQQHATERTIKGSIIGRKAWLFSATPAGARALANLYALVETAKANGREPRASLKLLLK